MLKRFPLALLVLASLPLFAAESDEPTTRQVMQENKSVIQNWIADIDYRRKQIVEANMDLTAQEGEVFWPIYNTYSTEADKLSKDAIALLLDYARAYNAGSVSDENAAKLQERLLDLREDRLELKEKYAKRIAKELSPRRSLRFLQIEDQLDAISLLVNTSDVPLVE